jgi:hypothetical protein
VVVLSTAVVYAFYFWRAVAMGSAEPWRAGGLFVEAVILLVALQIAGQIAIAIRTRPEPDDERDRLIATAATRNAYWVLVVGAWGVIGVAVLSLGTFWSVHAMLLAIVLAELTRWGSQLFYYRHGV